MASYTGMYDFQMKPAISFTFSDGSDELMDEIYGVYLMKLTSVGGSSTTGIDHEPVS